MSAQKPRDDKDSEARRKEIGRRKELADRKAALAWLGTLGIVGWSVAIPILLGIVLGRWMDSLFGTGPALMIVFLVAGIVLGCGAAWRWIKKRIEAEKH
ncbi:MAG: AtpZ/AtpI family protein [Rectinemataceae bacterium]